MRDADLAAQQSTQRRRSGALHEPGERRLGLGVLAELREDGLEPADCLRVALAAQPLQCDLERAAGTAPVAPVAPIAAAVAASLRGGRAGAGSTDRCALDDRDRATRSAAATMRKPASVFSAQLADQRNHEPLLAFAFKSAWSLFDRAITSSYHKASKSWSHRPAALFLSAARVDDAAPDNMSTRLDHGTTMGAKAAASAGSPICDAVSSKSFSMRTCVANGSSLRQPPLVPRRMNDGASGIVVRSLGSNLNQRSRM